MKITNYNELVKNRNKNWQDIRRNILSSIDLCLNSINPTNLIRSKISILEKKIKISDNFYDLNEINDIYVVGFGKASGLMAQEIEKILEQE